MRILDPDLDCLAAFEFSNWFAPESLVPIRFARGMMYAIAPRRDILVGSSTVSYS